MRKIFRGILGLIFGELIVLFRTSKTLKSRVKKAEGLDKAKVVLRELFDFNKEIVMDIQSIDYQGEFGEIKDGFMKEIGKLEENFNEIKDKAVKMGSEKFHEITETIEKKVHSLKKKLHDTLEDVSEKLEIEEKIDAVMHKFKKLKTQFTK